MSGPLLAAVVFTDLVGSTAQRSELGEEVGEELRRAHDRVLGDAVEAHGGRVVKSTGDGIMATFPGAAEAVAGAVAIQQVIDRHNRRADAIARLSVRTGVSAGDVTWEEDDAFGSPVIEAARLCARAEGGQILAADVVRVLAGTREGDRFSPVGDLDLKGLPGPTSTWEVGWEPDTGPAVPVPGGLARVGRFGFVGREVELGVLGGAWEETRRGDRRVVVVSGEPGIGKSALVGQFAREAHSGGATVLYGRCDAELGVPFQPWVEALGGYVEGASRERLAAQVGPLGGELVRLVPSLGVKVPGVGEPLESELSSERFRMFEAVAEFLVAIAVDAPTLLVIDDLQWAGQPTLLLLRHVVRSTAPGSLLLVATFRHTEVDADHPLTAILADLHRDEGVERITLGGLAEPEVAELTDRAGYEPGTGREALAGVLHAQTDGNPFFVGELLAHLGEIADGVPPDRLDVPAGVTAVVQGRLGRLSPGCREVLTIGAVIGPEYEGGLVAACSAQQPAALVDALEEAERAYLVEPAPDHGERYGFAHALVRTVLLEGLTSARRLRLHQQVGLAIEARPDAAERAAELAHHFLAAVPLGETERAIRYSRQAGDRALHSQAFEEAVLHYTQALDALENLGEPERATRCDLRIALGDALQRAGDPRYRDTFLDAADDARVLDDPVFLARSAQHFSLFRHANELGVVDQQIVDLVEDALDGLGPEHAALRARLLADLAGLLEQTPMTERRRPLMREAVDIARGLDDRPTLAAVLSNFGFAIDGPDDLEERRSVARELIALGEELQDPEVSCYGYVTLCGVGLESGDLRQADRALGHAEVLAAECRHRYILWFTSIVRVARALLDGDLAGGEDLAAETLSLGRAASVADSRSFGVYGGQVFQLRDEQGRLGELEQMVRGLLEDQPGVPNWRTGLAGILCENDQAADARPHLERLAEDDFVSLPRDQVWLTGLVGLSRVVRALADQPRAQTLIELLRPYERRVTYNRGFSNGPVDLALGRLAATLEDFDDAERYFAQSADWCDQAGVPTFLARTHLEWAQMLVQRGRPSDRLRARELAADALTAAEELGMARVAIQAREVLDNTR